MFLRICVVFSLLALLAIPAAADSVFFSTGDPNGLMATGSRPSSGGKIEIESADDFLLTSPMTLTGATFTGLQTGGATEADIGEVRVEIYHVFPLDSTDPPSGHVPTRTNSPSDVEFADRDTASSNLKFTTTLLNNNFTVGNSVLNGINPIPDQKTGGEGPVTGEEVQFNVTFLTPFDLPADHYFFVPQVEITTADGEFMWLSAPKPIVPPGTPFLPDLQTWIRNENLAPDWLKIGDDIEGEGRAFNAAFSLKGEVVPEPSTWTMLAGALGFLALGRKKLIKR